MTVGLGNCPISCDTFWQSSLKKNVKKLKKILKVNRKRYLAPLSIFTIFIVPMLFYAATIIYAAHAEVGLGTTEDFAVLAGSAISDTGTTDVTGDVGLDPAGGASITGLTCAEVDGTIYDNNAGYTGGGGGSTACLVTNGGLLSTAKDDLVTAYNDAAGRTPTEIATELAGETLTDGTYDSAAGTFEIAGAGTLTLDGEGNADAVFIFQMASTLVTGADSNIVLANGAQACNVFWQVGSSATLGTTTDFTGTIMAVASITDDGGSTIAGRLLADADDDGTGAVTLNNTTIAVSTCATATPTPTTTTSSLGSTGTSVTYCPLLSSTIVAPFILKSQRVSPTSISFSWGPYSGTNFFNVQYGFENGNWLYNTNVTGFSTTINDLPPNRPIWVRVAARNDCTIGNYGESRFVGGPGLPSTGFAPHRNDIY